MDVSDPQTRQDVMTSRPERAQIGVHPHEGFVVQQSFSLTHTLNPICLDRDPNPLSTAMETSRQ